MKRNLESPKTKIERKAREIDIEKETSEFAEDKIDHLKTYPISSAANSFWKMFE